MSTPIAYIVLDESSPRLIAGQYQFERACSGALIIPSGSSFPTDPFSGEIFWKTDEVKLYRRNNSNTTWESAVGGSSDSAASYVVLGLTSSLSNERSLSSSFGITFVDNGANNTIEININEVEIPVLSASNTFTGPNIFTSGLSGSHTHLDDGTSYLLAGPGIVINSESNGAVAISGSGGDADPGASYVVIGLTGSLTNERALSSSFGNKIVDLGANANVEINVDEAEIPVLSASNTFTGVNSFTAGLSGSLTQLTDGSSYIVAGDNINISSASNGAVTINASAGVGGSVSGEWKFSTNTTDADPGAGRFRFNNAAYASVTEIYIDDIGDSPAFDYGLIFATLHPGDEFLIQENLDSTSAVIFQIDTISDEGGYWKFEVTYLADAGGDLIGNNKSSTIAMIYESDHILHNLSATSDPGTGDDSGAGYQVGSVWVNLTSDQAFLCVDATAAAAVWKNITEGGADPGAQYVVMANTASLPNERAVTGSFGVEIIDGGANGNVDFKISETEIPVLSASNNFSGINTFTAGLSGSLTKLADGTDYLLAGPGIVINSSSNGPIEISGSGGDGDSGASYIVIGLTASLSNERFLSGATDEVSIVDNGANGSVVIGLIDVDDDFTPGDFTDSTFTVDAKGRITSASNDLIVLKAKNGSAARFDSIGGAIAVASDGDLIEVGAGTWPESFTIPTGVSIRGIAGPKNTIIEGAAGTGTRVTMGLNSSFEGFSILLPTDATSCVLNAQSSGDCRVFNINISGSASGSAIAIHNNGLSRMFLSDYSMDSGACDSFLQISNGTLIAHNGKFVGGESIDAIRITNGTGSINGFDIRSTTTQDVISVDGGTLEINTLQTLDNVNGIHITTNDQTSSFRNSSFDSSVFDLFVDDGLNAGSTNLSTTDLHEGNASLPSTWLTGSDFIAIIHSKNEGENALRIIQELHVGLPEKGYEATFGEGDSYVRGMTVFTTDSTPTDTTDGGNITDVSTAAATNIGSTFSFQGTTADHTILIGSTLKKDGILLKHWGIKSLQTTASSTNGVYGIEVWDGSAWSDIGFMSTESSKFYRYANEVFIRANSSEQIRFGIDEDTVWATKTINSVEAYWVRIRINSAPSTAPVFEQFKLHSSRTEINENGTNTYFGLSQFHKTLAAFGNVFGENGSVSDVSSLIGGGTTGTGLAWNQNFKNAHFDSTSDVVYTQITLPKGICTAYPLEFYIYFENYNSGGGTTAPTSRFSCNVLEVVGNLEADPAGGIVPVQRTAANTENMNAKTAIRIDTVWPDVTGNKVHRLLVGSIDISNRYEGDMFFVRLHMVSRGSPLTEMLLFNLEVNGVQWTHGERL